MSLPQIERLETLKMSLRDLFKRRFEATKHEAETPVAQEEGELLYQQILQEISNMMLAIKKEFPHRVSKSFLFDFVEDEEWRKSFEKNFSKLFIDRLDCRDGVQDDFKFNQSTLASNASGANLCYAEGFALGFLTMLHQVAQRFAENDFREIESQNLVELFSIFNEILIGNDGLKDDKGRYFSAKATYETIVQRKEDFDEYGKNLVFYFFPNCEFTTLLYEDFQHALIMKEKYQEYLLQRQQEQSDKVALTSKLLVDLASGAHLHSDGNTRAAILCGWMLSLLHNEPFAVATFQDFIDQNLCDEAKTWIREFSKNPEHPAISDAQHELFMNAVWQNYTASEVDKVVGTFMSETLHQQNGGKLFFEIPFDITQAMRLGKSDVLLDAFVITNHEHDFKEPPITLDLQVLADIALKYSDKLRGYEKFEKNNALAFYFLHLVSKNEIDNSDKPFCATIRLVMESYNPQEFTGDTARRFEEIQKKIAANLTPKTSAEVFDVESSGVSQSLQLP